MFGLRRKIKTCFLHYAMATIITISELIPILQFNLVVRKAVKLRLSFVKSATLRPTWIRLYRCVRARPHPEHSLTRACSYIRVLSYIYVHHSRGVIHGRDHKLHNSMCNIDVYSESFVRRVANCRSIYLSVRWSCLPTDTLEPTSFIRMQHGYFQVATINAIVSTRLG